MRLKTQPYPNRLIESIKQRMNITGYLRQIREDGIELMAFYIKVTDVNPDDYDLIEYIIRKEYKLERAISFGARVVNGDVCEIFLYCSSSLNVFEYALSVLKKNDKTIGSKIV